MSRHAQIEDRAIQWLIRRDEPDWSVADQLELTSWVNESMANRAAYLRAESGWAAADRIGALGEMTDGVHRSTRSSFAWWAAAAAASLVIALGIGGYLSAPAPAPPVPQARFDTTRGARKIVSLTDGSRVELNTQSTIRTAINTRSRDIWLDSGEAYFEVARRDGNLFVVHAGRQTITVLGTKFAVRRDKDRVTVDVVEGRVQIEDSQRNSRSATIVTAGDTVITRAGSTLIAPKSEARVERALTWREGMLTFSVLPLSEVAAEFNRYNRIQLSVDPSAASIPIGGTFQASNVEAFARLLHDAYGLKAERSGQSIKISE